MFRALILLALTAPASFSQISGLATTDTGGQLYFSTSLRLRGTHGNFDPKILRYVGVFQPFREAELQTPQQNPFTTNYFQLTGPQVSGDSTVVAYTANAVCTNTGSPSGCLFDALQQGNIVGLSVASNLLDDGEIVLSGDKRYALMINGQLVSSPRLIDLATGKVTVIANYGSVGDHQIFADDGSILLQALLTGPPYLGQLVLWNPVSPVPLQLSQPLQLIARLSRNRSKVVY